MPQLNQKITLKDSTELVKFLHGAIGKITEIKQGYHFNGEAGYFVTFDNPIKIATDFGPMSGCWFKAKHFN